MSTQFHTWFLPTCGILLILTCAFAGCSSTQSPTPQTPAQPVIQHIDSTDSGFSPNYIQIRPGTIVNWTNTGKNIHSISSNFVGEQFNSATLNPGQSYQHTYINLGTQPYFDGINHAYTGIVSVVK